MLKQTFGQQFAELLCSIELHVDTVTVQATEHLFRDTALTCQTDININLFTCHSGWYYFIM